MVDKGVIACVSGGADSVCMLYLLWSYCKKNGKNMICAHFNHRIRGKEADSDMAFVHDLCKTLGIDFFSSEEDIPSLAKRLNKGIEETARQARYTFFGKLSNEYGYTIAVAHNRNDRLETVIHNILRGTSLEGLKGIPYVRDNIVRPMLNISREEIEAYLHENHIEYRTDSTNQDTLYTRNRIRHIVIPLLKEQFGDGVNESILRLSDLSIKDNEFINMTADEKASGIISVGEGIKIDAVAYSNLHVALRSRILIKALCLVRNSEGNFLFNAGTGIEMSAVKRIDNFIINGGSGKYVEAAKGVIAKKEYGYVYLVIANNMNRRKKEYRLESEITAIGAFSRDSLRDKDCACFDYDALIKITGEMDVSLRTRREGDIFRPYGFNGTKKLKKFFTDEKIPVSERDDILLLALGSNILWIPGIRISGLAPIDNVTKNVIIFRLHEN